MQHPPKSTFTFLGKASVFLSSLCVLHCMATPFILLFLPAISVFFSTTLEHILVLSVVPLSLAGFVPTWLHHKNYRLLVMYILSVSLILFSQFVLHAGHSSHDSIDWLSTSVTFTGALLLAVSVFQNNRHTHHCTHPGHHKTTPNPGDKPL
ncbi:MerC domain-containing protein [Balneolaceae bacterium ANBcel3]|nr:MerC domain-containing protein [Balneolaceae bacterium ANBcel3]